MTQHWVMLFCYCKSAIYKWYISGLSACCSGICWNLRDFLAFHWFMWNRGILISAVYGLFHLDIFQLIAPGQSRHSLPQRPIFFAMSAQTYFPRLLISQYVWNQPSSNKKTNWVYRRCQQGSTWYRRWWMGFDRLSDYSLWNPVYVRLQTCRWHWYMHNLSFWMACRKAPIWWFLQVLYT